MFSCIGSNFHNKCKPFRTSSTFFWEQFMFIFHFCIDYNLTDLNCRSFKSLYFLSAWYWWWFPLRLFRGFMRNNDSSHFIISRQYSNGFSYFYLSLKFAMFCIHYWKALWASNCQPWKSEIFLASTEVTSHGLETPFSTMEKKKRMKWIQLKLFLIAIQDWTSHLVKSSHYLI